MNGADAITIMQKLRASEVFNVVLTGGEPLLNFDVCIACAKYAQANGMGVSVNSTLETLTPERAKALRSAGVRHILTSLTGPTADVHDAITQLPGAYDRLMARIPYARSAGIGVSTNMVVTQYNLQYLRETAELAEMIGAVAFTATKASCPGNCSDFSEQQLSREQLTDFANTMSWLRDHLAIPVETLSPVPLCALDGVSLLDQFVSRKCLAGITTIAVSHDGAVRPCAHLDVEYGNLIEEDLDDIWRRLAIWADGEYTPRHCSTCSLLSRCGGGCRMEAKTRYGTLDDLDPYCSPGSASKVERALAISSRGRRKLVGMAGPFKTANYAIRTEEFGATVCLPGQRWVFLDKSGYAVLSQLGPEKTYDWPPVDIDWNVLDPESFILELAARNVLSFI